MSLVLPKPNIEAASVAPSATSASPPPSLHPPRAPRFDFERFLAKAFGAKKPAERPAVTPSQLEAAMPALCGAQNLTGASPITGFASGKLVGPTWSYPRVTPVFGHRAAVGAFDQSALLRSLSTQVGQRAIIREASDIDDISVPNGRVITESEADALAIRFGNDSTIPFGYIYDGCYARAHVMCGDMKTDNVAHAKMFIHEENPPPHLQASNPFMTAQWRYHVAPIVYVNAKTGVELRVLDPGIARRALTPVEWLGSCRNGAEITVDLTHAAQYYPRRDVGILADFDSSMPAARKMLAEYAQVFAQKFPTKPSQEPAEATV